MSNTTRQHAPGHGIELDLSPRERKGQRLFGFWPKDLDGDLSSGLATERIPDHDRVYAFGRFAVDRDDDVVGLDAGGNRGPTFDRSGDDRLRTKVVEIDADAGQLPAQ